MRETLTRLNEDFELRYGVVLATRTGINTGTVAGKGVPDRNFVAGDAANSAARLQQNADPGAILLAESTFRLVRDSVEAERLAAVDLRGKHEVITAYRLLAVGERSEVAPRLEAPLVGRQTRSLSSTGRWSRRSRSRRLVTVVGAPGIGKSRLAHEFAQPR